MSVGPITLEGFQEKTPLTKDQVPEGRKSIGFGSNLVIKIMRKNKENFLKRDVLIQMINY